MNTHLRAAAEKLIRWRVDHSAKAMRGVSDELRGLWKAALERDGNLASAVADVMWKATQYGTTEDGDTFAYIVPKGAMHRLIGVAQSNGAHVQVAFRNTSADGAVGASTEEPAPAEKAQQ